MNPVMWLAILQYYFEQEIPGPHYTLSNMASSLAETITTNFLNCAICFETYRDPRALPCQHSFCCECLEQCVRSSEDKRTLVCPTCRKVVNISAEGVKDLPVHFLVSNLKDTVDMEQKVNINKWRTHQHIECNFPDD